MMILKTKKKPIQTNDWGFLSRPNLHPVAVPPLRGD